MPKSIHAALFVMAAAAAARPVAAMEPNVGMPQATWTPPKSSMIPDSFMQGVQLMLAHGFADPRGGKLVRAKISIRSLAYQLEPDAVVAGWLMPKIPGHPSQLILPCGLSYDVLEVKGPATPDDLMRQSDGQGELSQVADLAANPAAELLLWGDLHAAEVAYQRPTNRFMPFGTQTGILDDFLAARYRRVIAAYLQGQDAQARDEAQFLTSHLANLAAAPKDAHVQSVSWEFLNPLYTLIPELDRRLRQHRPAHFDVKSVAKLPQAERVQALVAALDQVTYDSLCQPQGMNLQGDPIVASLIAEKDAAVEPLLHAMQSDDRLVRAVSYGLNIALDRSMVTVRDVAYVGLREILQSHELGQNGQAPDVDTLRAYWIQHRGLSAEDRWFQTLADDHAHPEQWLGAANRILDPAGVVRVSGSVTWHNPPPGTKLRRQGESLRSRKNPSVSKLMAARVTDVLKRSGSPFDVQRYQNSLEMALCLANWDPSAALPSLRQATQATFAAFRPTVGDGPNLVEPSLMARALKARVLLGDPTVFDEYCQQLPGLMRNCRWPSAQLLYPMILRRREPRMRDLARRIFTDPRSPWGLVSLRADNESWSRAEGLLPTGALAIPEVQAELRECLRDRAAWGYVWHDETSMHYEEEHLKESGLLSPEERTDPDLPANRVKVRIRRADRMMTRLSMIKGIPRFEAYWPEAKRDKAIAQTLDFLQKHRDDILTLIQWPYRGDTDFNSEMLRQLNRRF